MINRFDEIFVEVMHTLGIENWYELVDSDNFDMVENAIVREFGESILEDKIFVEWVNEMVDDI